MKYSFKQETGVILGPCGQVLRLVEGSPSRVDFPADLIWDLHKKSPGMISSLAHTHPDGMDTLSHMDEVLFKGWTWALYPFPVHMYLITKVFDATFVTISWIGQLETKEEWISRGKEGERKFFGIEESRHYHNLSNYNVELHPWEELLINLSYKKNE